MIGSAGTVIARCFGVCQSDKLLRSGVVVFVGRTKCFAVVLVNRTNRLLPAFVSRSNGWRCVVMMRPCEPLEMFVEKVINF